MLNELGLYLAGTVMRGVGLWLAVTVVEWMWGRKLIGQKLRGLWWLLLIVTMVPFHQGTVRVRMEQPVTTTAVPAEASTAVEAAERAYPRTQFRQFPGRKSLRRPPWLRSPSEPLSCYGGFCCCAVGSVGYGGARKSLNRA